MRNTKSQSLQWRRYIIFTIDFLIFQGQGGRQLKKTKPVLGEKQVYSGNLKILPGMGKPGKFSGKSDEIFWGH